MKAVVDTTRSRPPAGLRRTCKRGLRRPARIGLAVAVATTVLLMTAGIASAASQYRESKFQPVKIATHPPADRGQVTAADTTTSGSQATESGPLSLAPALTRVIIERQYRFQSAEAAAHPPADRGQVSATNTTPSGIGLVGGLVLGALTAAACVLFVFGLRSSGPIRQPSATTASMAGPSAAPARRKAA